MNRSKYSAATFERFRLYLAGRGLRLTAQREAVLSAVCERKGHFDADELHGALRAAGGNVSLATVYRTLGLLSACGLVKQAPRWRSRERYETVHGGEHHDHMLCVKCGRVIEFCDDGLEAMQQRICRRRGFQALEHRMAIRGICRSCRSRRPQGGD